MDFQDFTLRFLVDENLENYMQIQNWMRGLAFPDSLRDIYDLWQGKTDFPDALSGLKLDGSLLRLEVAMESSKHSSKRAALK